MADDGTVSDITSIISALGTAMAPWLPAITGTQITATSTPAQIAAAQRALQLQTQANFAAQNPTLAGLFNNPTVLVLGVAIIVLLLWMAFKKGG